MNSGRADVENPLAARLEAAAALLADPAAGGKDSELLRYLAYDDGDEAKAEGRARILRAAARLKRLFLLSAPDAPGLVFFGGEADARVLGLEPESSSRASLAGSGLSPQRAFESCVGEGIEYLSQFLQPSDRFETGSLGERSDGDPERRRFLSEVFAAAAVDLDRPIDWVAAERLSDKATARFPLDLCYRRPPRLRDFEPPYKLSTGCAAGATLQAATLRGLLELVERDAVALWWRGGRQGAAIAPDSEACVAAKGILERLRGGGATRRTWFLDITTDVGIPAVAALSANPDGYGFCYGLAARLTLVEATHAALFELCQVELGQHVVAAKLQESGDEALNESDLRQLRRGAGFDANRCALLQPRREPPPNAAAFSDDPALALAQLVNRLQAMGISAYALDLTRSEFATPVVRVLAPGLQLEPSQIATPRLETWIAETGGGALQHGGMPLL